MSIPKQSFSWGRSEFGQLGLGSFVGIPNTNVPNQIDFAGQNTLQSFTLQFS
jgi:hypothetical protein